MTSPLIAEAKQYGLDLTDALRAVEARLEASFADDESLVTLVTGHLNHAGGKRFRPVVSLLSSMVGGMEPTHPDAIDGAVLVELTHQSTLYHDDVMDNAPTRRNQPSAHEQWSNTVAILAGDWLLARASLMASTLDARVVPELARCVASLARGQIREVVTSAHANTHQVPALTPSVERYLSAIEGKTASLVASSAAIGGMVSGLDDEAVACLRQFGYHTGMAFQIADDVIDITADTEVSGKTPGTDLREGVRTLPVLFAIQTDGLDSDLARWVDDPTQEHVALAVDYLRAHPAIEQARALAFDHIDRAGVALGSLVGGREDIIDALMAMAAKAVDRIA
ncbi:polyprenyl synthetase family protein [Stomatohabitans albus]|uniref:polyprenyl synthetase family protein n=1 Tax=Stomatohabitans albus TaxID=3110766 RepID=UPI00300D04B9